MELIKTSYKLEGFVESRKGGRPENQDYLDYRDTGWGFLVVVCDGMGGGPAGQVASSQAVNAIINYIDNTPFEHSLSPEKLLRDAISYANTHLLDLQRKNTQLRGMGTTATVLLINKNSAKLAHIGDSRIYQLRFGRKKFRTTDHSQVMELVKVGTLTEEEARTAPNSNVITRALGVTETVDLDFCEVGYEKGDRFVLCTDGVWGSMPESKLVDLLAKTKTLSGTVESTMITVEEIGKDNGGHHDNFTLALVKTNNNSILKEPMSHKVRNILVTLIVICCISLIANAILAYSLLNKKSVEPSSTSIQGLMSGKNTQAYIDSLVQVKLQDEKNKKDTIKSGVIETPKEQVSEDINKKEISSQVTEKSDVAAQPTTQDKTTSNQKDDAKSENPLEKLKNDYQGIKSELTSLSKISASKAIPQTSLDSLEKKLSQLCKDLRNNNMTAQADLIERDVIAKLKNSVAKNVDNSKKDIRKGHYNELVNTLDKILKEVLK